MRTLSRAGYGLCAVAAMLAIGARYTVSADAKAAPSAASGPAAPLLDTSDGRNWAGYGRTYGEQHFSPLTELDTDSAGKLGLAWSLDLQPGNTVTQPLAVDGVLYFTVGNSIIHAVDAVSGKLLWRFDPKANEAAGMRMRTSWGSRGIGYWNGKIYTGTVDGRLIAVDAKTGRELWSQQTLQPGDLRYITGAPRLFDGKVIIGHGGGDSANIRGYVTTYDAETGKQLWRFFVVPGDPSKGFEDETQAMAAKTWAGEWWKYGGGGNVWNTFTYDAETDTILLGTGNGAPWNHRVRSAGKGDNLFVCSIVALDAKTGKYKWHYQINPGETWDYNASMDMHLADLTIGGRPRKVVVTAPKNGFLYVIDRITGKLVSAEKIAKVTWASHIDLKTGRPDETPGARYPDGTTFELWPSMSGAHTNLPSAFSPKTRLVYIPVTERGVLINDANISPAGWERRPQGQYDFALNLDLRTGETDKKPTSSLMAWNPVTQKQVWKVPTPLMWNGGVLVTAGDLVFQGQADGRFSAYHALTGERLWSIDAGGAVLAPPISYSVGGRQYVTVLTGMGLSGGVEASNLPVRFDYRTQPRRVLTFVLGGTGSIPPLKSAELKPMADPSYKPDAAAATRGAATFGRCMGCHGIDADAGGGLAPDLRTSPMVLAPAPFEAVVRKGVLVSRGMPAYPELSDAELADLRHYIRSRGAALRNQAKP